MEALAGALKAAEERAGEATRLRAEERAESEARAALVVEREASLEQMLQVRAS